MAARPSVVLLLSFALTSLGASYRTQNFVVEAPTPAIAKQVGEYAEHYRREKALQWLGQEMPPWPEPCPLRVTLSANGSGGATQFAFDRGRILGQDMHIEGSLDRLLASVLPHEVTHTVFAHYFRTPVPRWADEGGSVLSEDERERREHDALVRHILNTPGRAMPLRRLFALRDYPQDVMVLYAEGFSVTEFLVNQNGRPAFLAFVNHGMRYGWDDAVSKHYRYRNVEELEGAWRQHLRDTRRQPPEAILAGGRGAGDGDGNPRVVVRQTVPPAQPLLQEPRPVYRGQMAEESASGERRATLTTRPGYLPDYRAPTVSAASPPPPPPPPVRLGAPQYESPPPGVQLGQPIGVPAPPGNLPR